MEERTYCKHYKKLIVEDFTFNENRVDLHYGKCSVIGLCTFDENVYYLANIRISSLSPDSQLPDGSTRVLLFTHLSNEPPPIDKSVEVFGEAVLYDTTIPFEIASSVCLTSKDLMKMSREEAKKGTSINDFESITQQRFRPAIRVFEFVAIDNAHELINYNLRLKKFIDKS